MPVDDSYFLKAANLAVGHFGPAIIWSSRVGAELVQEMSESGAREVLITAPGDKPIGSLDALADADQVIGMILLPGRKMTASDWSVIEGLRSLRYVTLSHDEVGGDFNLSTLPDLRWYSGPWWPGLRSLDLVALEGIWLRRLRRSAAGLAMNGKCLRTLTLGGGFGGDLLRLGAFPALRSLRLHMSRGLASLRGIEEFRELREVEINRAPALSDVSSLSMCRQLRKVLFEDCPELNALDLSMLQNLEGLWMFGRTRVKNGCLKWLEDAGLVDSWVRAYAGYDVDCDRLPAAPASLAYSRPPSYEYRMPTIRRYADIVRPQYARVHGYPSWFRRDHPKLCLDCNGLPLGV